MAFRGKGSKVKKYKVPRKSLLKKGDQVVIICGKDKRNNGKASGTIKIIYRKKGLALVDGVNIVKKHKKRTSVDQPPQIVDISLPVPLTKLMYFSDKLGRGVRLGTKEINGKKVRYARKHDLIID